jgi:hypothetical protein
MRNRSIVIHAAAASSKAAIAAAALMLLGADPSVAAPKWQPGDKSAEDCIYEGRQECDDLICSCCFDNGCWICNDELEDCVWDPAARQKKKIRIIKPLVPQTLDPTLDPGRKPLQPKIFQKPGTTAPAIQ